MRNRNQFGVIWKKGGEIMFTFIIIALAGISLYFLLKPPADFQNEQAFRCESIYETELVVTRKPSMPTIRVLGKDF